MFKISWPDSLTMNVERALGVALDKVNFASVATSVLQVSDLFIAGENAKQSKTPWTDLKLRQAYLSYFFPLNTLRVMRILDEACNRGFFEGLDHVIDIGSGPGTVELAFELSGLLNREGRPSGLRFQNFEPAREAQKTHLMWKSNACFVDRIKPFPAPAENKSMFVLSYSLNEMTDWPLALDSAEALMIIEPSTRDHGRRLMQVRQRLIEKGFSLWAPCTHQLDCPLLTKTKTDWCHHRFGIGKPPWFEELESHLPMRNDTLTVSYLLARRTNAVDGAFTRVIGDTLFEKGKVRQMICRGPEREFLSYLTRQNRKWDGLPNGALVQLPENLTQKTSELRLENADLEKLVPVP